MAEDIKSVEKAFRELGKSLKILSDDVRSSDSGLRTHSDVLRKYSEFIKKNTDRGIEGVKKAVDLQNKLDKIKENENKLENRYLKRKENLYEKEIDNTLRQQKNQLFNNNIAEKQLKNKFNIEKNIIDYSKSHSKDITEYFKQSGIKIKSFDASNKDQREALIKLIDFNKKKLEFEKKVKEEREKNWWEETKFSKRVSTGFKNSAKDFLLEKTGILGSSIKFASKLMGRDLTGETKEEAKQRQIEKIKSPIESTEDLIESQNELGETINKSFRDLADSIEDFKDNKLFTKKDKTTVDVQNKVKTDKSDFSMRNENKGDALAEQKLTNKSLKKMLFKMGKSSMGLMGLAGLLAAGGLIGFLLTGKSEFLGGMVKGIIKGGLVLQKAFSTALKFPKLFGGKAIKGLIGKLGDFGLGSIWKKLYKGAGRLAKTLGSFGKIGGLMGKAVKGIGKAFGFAALKKIPLIGLLVSIPLAISRFMKGDFLGGLLELASGGASIIPGIGTALSIAIDLFSLGRDVKRSVTGESGMNKSIFGGKKGSNIISKVVNNPIRTVASGGKNLMESGATTQTSNEQVQNLDISQNEQLQDAPQAPETSSDSKENAQMFRLHPDDIKELANQISKGTGGEFNKLVQDGKMGSSASSIG